MKPGELIQNECQKLLTGITAKHIMLHCNKVLGLSDYETLDIDTIAMYLENMRDAKQITITGYTTEGHPVYAWCEGDPDTTITHNLNSTVTTKSFYAESMDTFLTLLEKFNDQSVVATLVSKEENPSFEETVALGNMVVLFQQAMDFYKDITNG